MNWATVLSMMNWKIYSLNEDRRQYIVRHSEIVSLHEGRDCIICK